MGDGLFVITVFLEGVASFLSPCVLPLIPAYLTYLTGQTMETLVQDAKTYRTVIWNALAFILGFSVIFIALGAAATSFGKFLVSYREVIRKVSGVLIIILGLFQMEIIKIGFLNYEKRLKVNPKAPGFITSVIMGVGFGFGWTPCIGPILASVLMMASQAKTLGLGMALLAVYSMGLALPFFILALGIKVVWNPLRRLYKYMNVIRLVSGVLLVFMGLVIFFNWLSFF
jgi:cytochrome c-type biogenesis protein